MGTPPNPVSHPPAGTPFGERIETGTQSVEGPRRRARRSWGRADRVRPPFFVGGGRVNESFNNSGYSVPRYEDIFPPVPVEWKHDVHVFEGREYRTLPRGKGNLVLVGVSQKTDGVQVFQWTALGKKGISCIPASEVARGDHEPGATMTAEQKLAMLELEHAADVDRSRAEAEVFTGEADGVKAVPPSPTVLEIDGWSRRKGAELVEQSEEIRGAAKLPEQVPANPWSNETERYWADAVADFHAAAFEVEVNTAANPADKLRAEYITELMQTTDFQSVRAQTVLNPVAAEVAAVAFAAQFAGRVAEEKKAKNAPPPPGKGGKGGGKVVAPPTPFDAEIATMRAAARAVAAAKQAVDEAADAAAMCGLGDGDAGTKRDLKRIAGVHKRVSKSPRLKKIAEMAGKFRRLAASKQRQKVHHGVDEVVGVTLGDEIGRLLPVELLKLVDADMELDTMRRLTERQTMTREVRATEPVGKGPIVVTVDESGSMDSNDKIETAKGLALALAWIARKQKRWCVLVGFSGGKEGTYCVLNPKSGSNNEQELLDWLEHFYGGGTTLDVPLDMVPAKWDEFVAAGMLRGKTDCVMITDGLVNIPADIKARFLDFKVREKVKLTTICVEGSPGQIAEVADEVHEIPALDTGAEAVGGVLSV